MKTARKADKAWQMFGVPMFSGGISEVLKKVEERMNQSEKRFWIATVNPEFIVATWSDSDFWRILIDQTDLNVADGVGMVWAKRVQSGQSLFDRVDLAWKTGVQILGGGLRDELAPGSDLIERFCELAANKGKTVFFLGGFNGAGQMTADHFSKKYKGLKVAGIYEGKSRGEDEKVIEVLKGKRVDFLFVAYGMKTQEEWVKRNIDKINVGVVMGVGRSFDYYSGQLQRAPKVWRKTGFEWLYSLIKEPKRWRRQLALPRFLWRVMTSKAEKVM